MPKQNFLDHIIIEKDKGVNDVFLSMTGLDHKEEEDFEKIFLKKRPKVFERLLRQQQFSVIAEIKKRSPSVGVINDAIDATEQAKRYVEAGASILSVLTDGKHFGGSLEDLEKVSSEIKKSHPEVVVLRKDFIIHPIQLIESCFYGADAVLLIVGLVGKKLKTLLKIAKELCLEALVEVHNKEELAIALEAEAPIIGINNRNLDTLKVDLAISEKLKPLVPSDQLIIAESGIQNISDAQKMKSLGFSGVLIGEALMRCKDLKEFIKKLQRSEL